MNTLHFTTRKIADARYHLARDAFDFNYVIVENRFGMTGTVLGADAGVVYFVDWRHTKVHIDEMRKHLQGKANEYDEAAATVSAKSSA